MIDFFLIICVIISRLIAADRKAILSQGTDLAANISSVEHSVVKVPGRKIPPSRGRSRERPKIKSRAKIFEIFSCAPPSGIHQRTSENKKRPSYRIGNRVLIVNVWYKRE